MEDIEFFYGTEHPLSQWYPSHFVVEEITFNTAEQWMMYAKARLFDDTITANRILESGHPSQQRKLGRQVRFYKESVWVRHCKQIVYQGNYEKFTQNAELKDYLLSTENRMLAEATATDLRWGIGMSLSDTARYNRAQWLGLNLLGEIIMQVREKIRNSSSQTV